MTVTHQTSSRWQGMTYTGRLLADGTPEPDKPVIIKCNGSHSGLDLGLCWDCSIAFEGVLTDVPALYEDLDVAIAEQARFVERGTRLDSLEVATEYNPAIAAHHRLTTALMGAAQWVQSRYPARMAIELLEVYWQAPGLPSGVHDDARMVKLAQEVSQAAARVHHAIDRPQDWHFYGLCPDCDHNLWQERIHSTDENTQVECHHPGCGYRAPLEDHHRRLLETARDRWMTVGEAVAAFTLAGKPLTRQRINNWASREGLPREMRPVLAWRAGMLEVVRQVATYRVGDLEDMLTEMEERIGLRWAAS